MSTRKNQYFKVIKYMNTLRVSPSGTDVPMMRTRAKMQIVTSDRARRKNVTRHLF